MKLLFQRQVRSRIALEARHHRFKLQPLDDPIGFFGKDITHQTVLYFHAQLAIRFDRRQFFT